MKKIVFILLCCTLCAKAQQKVLLGTTPSFVCSCDTSVIGSKINQPLTTGRFTYSMDTLLSWGNDTGITDALAFVTTAQGDNVFRLHRLDASSIVLLGYKYSPGNGADRCSYSIMVMTPQTRAVVSLYLLSPEGDFERTVRGADTPGNAAALLAHF